MIINITKMDKLRFNMAYEYSHEQKNHNFGFIYFIV